MEISIKKPCHENWSEMTPNEQGAFCGKCVKTVVDFSTRSLEEIRDFFAGRREEKICGRFEERQLTALSFDAFFERFKRFEFTKRFAVILFFTFGLWLFGATPLSAQSKEPIKGDVMVEEQVEPGNVKVKPADKEKANCAKPEPGVMRTGAVITSTAQPKSYIIGQAAPAKQTPVKDPATSTPKQKPEKHTPAKPQSPENRKMGEVEAPLPEQKTAPKKQ